MRCYERCDKTCYIHAQKLLLAVWSRGCGGWFAGSATNLQLHSLPVWYAARHCSIAARRAPAMQPARRSELPLARARSSIALLQPKCSGGRYSQSAQICSRIRCCIILWWPSADCGRILLGNRLHKQKKLSSCFTFVMLVCE